VVDDGSADDSLQYVASEHREITILKSRGKRGFAGSVNTGIQYALSSGAEFIAVANNDIQVVPAWLDWTVPILLESKSVGLVGFTEVNREREKLFFENQVNANTVEARAVKGLAGCLYVCAAAAFGRVGLFDEDYFMYGEDGDLFLRLIAAGYRLLETNIPVWHFGEGSSQHRRLQTTWLAYRNAVRVSVKNEGPLGVIRVVASLANQGCNPFLARSKDLPSLRRLRRYNPIVNGLLLVGSCIWNCWQYPSTRRARR
jgi:GT2 family glycosyltransferase